MATGTSAHAGVDLGGGNSARQTFDQGSFRLELESQFWTLEKLRLVRGLRRVPEEKILLSQLADTRRRLSIHLSSPRTQLNARLRELLQASDAKLHQLGERWATLKAQYAEKAGALKAEYAEKAGALKAEYSERAIHQFEEARAALAEIRREVEQALALLERAGAPA